MSENDKPKLTIPGDVALDMIDCDVEGFTVLDCGQLVGDWRHGSEYLLVFEKDGEFWGFNYRTSGDEGIVEPSRGYDVSCFPVRRKTVITWSAA